MCICYKQMFDTIAELLREPLKTTLFPVSGVIRVSRGPQIAVPQEFADAIKSCLPDYGKDTTFLELP